jgi:site-specific recombinase XerD
MRTRPPRATRVECAAKVEYCEAYLKKHRRSWSKVSATSFRHRVYHFHRWLLASKINLRDIEAAEVKAYWRYLARRGVNENSIRQYQHSVKAFLKWASATGQIRRDAVELDIQKPVAPWLAEHAREINREHSNKIHRIYVGEFYDWVEREQLALETLTRKQLQAYERQLRAAVPPRSVGVRRINVRMVQNHLRWLCDRGRVKTSRIELGLGKRKMPVSFRATLLPPPAKKFLKVMAAHKRPSTLRGNQTQLRRFYQYLQHRQLSIESFTRLDFEEYIALMHRDGYAPQTRRDAIGSVQGYMSWLYECGLLTHDPEPIIRNFPRPRLPDYLPRNLQPEVDRLVQDRLEKKGDVIALALLLMRRTGIRIGDLRALRFDCVQDDPDGNSYLKVPIGKLYNERFIPLDAATLEVLHRVRALSRKNAGKHKPEMLAIREDGKPVATNDYHLVLYGIDEELRLDANQTFGEEPLVSHRLRHTFATSLLSAGLSIEAIKDLLGHRSFTMSLRYAQVTPQKLRNDYLKAIAAAEGNIKAPEIALAAASDLGLGVGVSLKEVLARLRAKLREGHSDKQQIAALIRRTERLRTELRKID